MHWALVLGLLLLWHGITLLVLWFIPLPPRLEKYKPYVMVAGVILAVVIALRHSGLL